MRQRSLKRETLKTHPRRCHQHGDALKYHPSSLSPSSYLPMGGLLPGQKIPLSLFSLPPKPILHPATLRYSNLQTPRSSSSGVAAAAAAAAGSNLENSDRDQLIRKIKLGAGALVLTAAAAAAAFYAGNLAAVPARAEPSSAPSGKEEMIEERVASVEAEHTPSALSQFLESNPDAVQALRTLLYEKLDNGEYPEALRILDRLIAARPSETELKFLAARVHNEVGETAEARRLLEEILAADPLSFEALFENVVLMDRCGEGEAAVGRLERALETAREGKREKEARDVRLIMAQLQFLQKKVEEALSSYEELAREDPRDYRPYFCQGVIYSLLDRNHEAREKFAKYKELSPRKFEVEGFLQTPLSRVKLFSTGDAGM